MPQFPPLDYGIYQSNPSVPRGLSCRWREPSPQQPLLPALEQVVPSGDVHQGFLGIFLRHEDEIMLNAPLRDKDGDIFLIFLRKPLGKQGPVLIKKAA